MFLADDDPAMLGAWYNNWGDLVGDVKGIVAKVTQSGNQGGPLSTTHGYDPGAGNYPPGWFVMSPGAQQQYLDAMDLWNSDLSIIRAWTEAVRDEGAFPTRMPAGYANAGMLAKRMNGPGTWYPDDPEERVYVLAPQNVLDADARVRAALDDDQTGTLLAILKALGLAPGMAGNNPSVFGEEFVKYLKWGAIGVAAVVLLPYVLPARRR